jgi:hypothetical protein
MKIFGEFFKDNQVLSVAAAFYLVFLDPTDLIFSVINFIFAEYPAVSILLI